MNDSFHSITLTICDAGRVRQIIISHWISGTKKAGVTFGIATIFNEEVISKNE